MVDCTITNKRKPRVTVTKELVPSGDGGLFDLQVNGTTKADDVGDAGTTGSVNVAVGSNPTVGEVAGAGHRPQRLRVLDRVHGRQRRLVV